jgi:hypothetical protein
MEIRGPDMTAIGTNGPEIDAANRSPSLSPASKRDELRAYQTRRRVSRLGPVAFRESVLGIYFQSMYPYGRRTVAEGGGSLCCSPTLHSSMKKAVVP